MKSKENIWQTEYRGIGILVKNSWDFERTSEEICINGKRVCHREAPMDELSFKSATGLHFEWEENGTEITIKVGSAWYLFGVACQITINGKYHYGNRIVLFVDK